MSEGGDRLLKARCRLMITAPWYGHFAMSMTWNSHPMDFLPEEQRTISMRINNSGNIEVVYYEPYAAKRTMYQLYGEVQHMIEHLVRLHPLRLGMRDRTYWDVACDMVVNGKKTNPRIGWREGNTHILPHDDMFFLPDSFADDVSAEDVYDWLMKHQPKVPKYPQNGAGQGEGADGEGADGEGEGEGEGGEDGDGDAKGKGKGKPKKGKPGDGGGNPGDISGQLVDSHDFWSSSSASEDEARQLIKTMAQDASAKSQGNVPGHLAQILEALSEAKIRWRELLKNLMARHVGNRRTTFARRNRRYDAFGIKGVSHHAAGRVSVIVDTSGSIGTKELEQFFAEIESITHKAKVRVLQWDHAFQGLTMNYRRGDWKGFKVNGRGGTDMAAPVSFLEENGLIGDCCIMLTDGYCNWPHERNFPIIYVITEKKYGTPPSWGTVVHLDVNE